LLPLGEKSHSLPPPGFSARCSIRIVPHVARAVETFAPADVPQARLSDWILGGGGGREQAGLVAAVAWGMSRINRRSHDEANVFAAGGSGVDAVGPAHERARQQAGLVAAPVRAVANDRGGSAMSKQAW
jgi:hypothetical protein